MLTRSVIQILLLLAAAALGQTPDPAPDSVHVVSEKAAGGPDLVEWVYTLDCRADGAPPSLRVTLGNMGSSASAGVAMALDADGRATGTITLRVELKEKDKEARACTVSAQVSAAEGAMAGQRVRLPPGQDLATVADLKPLPTSAQLRRAISLGNIGGCMVSAYVMPGRSVARTPTNAAPPPGDPAVQAADLFRAWVQGVKAGELEPFAAVVPAAEWNAMDTAQRTQRLQEYQQAFKTVLGEDYNPAEFKLDYAPGSTATSGKLKVRYGEKELPDLTVRYAGGKWVLSEP